MWLLRNYINVILLSDKQVDNENCHECTSNVLFNECEASANNEFIIITSDITSDNNDFI